MKAKLFDKNVFLEDLRQLKGINIVYGVILLLQSVLVPLYMYISARANSLAYENYTINIELSEASILIVGIAIIMPIMTNSLFEFIDKRNSSDFYHSLPVRRETLYITHILAVLASCLVLYIVPLVLEGCILSALSCVKLSTNAVFYEFADVFTIGLLLSAVIIVSKCVCGTRFGVMAVFLMILVLPRLYLIYIREMVENIYPYVMLGYGNNIFWNQNWNLLFGLFSDAESIRSIIYTLVLALIYFVIGGVLFVKRKSEMAESVAINKRLQLLFRVMPALTFSMLPLLSLIDMIHYSGGIDGEDFVMLLILYVIAVVIYFLYEVITTRKLSSVIKAAPGLLVLLIGNIALFGVIEGYGAYQSKLGMDADNVKSVSFVGLSGYDDDTTGIFDYSSGSFYDEALLKIDFTDEEVIDILVDCLNATPEIIDSEYAWNTDDVYVRIKCSAGTIYRNIYIRDMDAFLDALLSSDQMFTLSAQLPDLDDYGLNQANLYYEKEVDYGSYTTEYNLDYPTLEEIYNQAVEELKTLDNRTVYNLTATYNDAPYLNVGLYDRSDMDNWRYYGITIYIDKELMPKTYALVSEYIDENEDEDEDYDIYEYDEEDTGTYYYDESTGEWIYEG